MDHSQRPVLNPCDLDYTLDVEDQENGLTMRIRVDNTPHVPFKLEFVVPAGTRLETSQVILDTTAGGELAIKQGDARLENVRNRLRSDGARPVCQPYVPQNHARKRSAAQGRFQPVRHGLVAGQPGNCAVLFPPRARAAISAPL